jgi:hypothetical protein
MQAEICAREIGSFGVRQDATLDGFLISMYISKR